MKELSDPDGWPALQLLFSLLLTAVCMLYAGALYTFGAAKERSKTISNPKIMDLSVYLLCVPLLIWAMFCASRMIQNLAALVYTENHHPVILYNLILVLSSLILIGITVFLFLLLPHALGRVYSTVFLRVLSFVGMISLLVNPLSILISALPNRLLASQKTDMVTQEEFLEIVDTAEENDMIDENQKEMIGNIFELDDVTASDIMTHRTEVEALSIDASCEEVIQLAVALGYSRIPIYKGNLDNIIGIAYVKDFLPHFGGTAEDLRLAELIRPTIFVPVSCRARDLLLEFKQKKMQLAVVVDEYGGTAGIVTMEDILESIVGDIEDENDEEESLITINEDGSLLCDGYADIEDVFELLGLDEVPDDIESETIGGFATALLERIPRKDEMPSVKYGDIKLTVTSSNDRRVKQVIVSKVMEPTQDPLPAMQD